MQKDSLKVKRVMTMNKKPTKTQREILIFMLSGMELKERFDFMEHKAFLNLVKVRRGVRIPTIEVLKKNGWITGKASKIGISEHTVYKLTKKGRELL